MIRRVVIVGLVAMIVVISTLLTLAYQTPEDKASPYDRINEGQVHIYPDKIVIDIDDATWATYADTNSMDPLLDKGANGLEIVPKTDNDLHIGDVAAYESKIVPGLIIHRIIDIKKDNQGTYYTFKGDNNKTQDPERVRFSQIKFILIGIIY